MQLRPSEPLPLDLAATTKNKRSAMKATVVATGPTKEEVLTIISLPRKRILPMKRVNACAPQQEGPVLDSSGRTLLIVNGVSI